MRKSSSIPINFNSHAHVERDKIINAIAHTPDISTHTLTWSVTRPRRFSLVARRFQLTRSRGAWLFLQLRSELARHFNSHAHVERDGRFSVTEMKTGISTHTLTWSVTSPKSEGSFQFAYFNSHAHVERDIKCTMNDCFDLISTHTLTWSVTFRGC